MNQEDLSNEIEILRHRVVELEASLKSNEIEAQGLRASASRYRQSVEGSPNAIIAIDREGRIVSWNNASTEVTGYQLRGAMGRDCSFLIMKPEPSHFSTEVLSRVCQGDRLSNLELDFRCSDGSIRRMISRAYPVRDGQDNVVECILANTDVTGLKCTEESLREDQVRLDELLHQRAVDLVKANEQLTKEIHERKKAEREARQSAERLTFALDGANLGIWEWDLTTGNAIWAQRTLGMLGYQRGDLEPNLKTWRRLVHADDWPKVSKNLNLHIEGKLPAFDVEYRILNKSGQWQWVQARGNVIVSGAEDEPTRMAGVLLDITDRKKAEETLKQSQETLALALEGAKVGTWDWDLCTGRAVSTDQTHSLFGYGSDQPKPDVKNWKRLVHPDDWPDVSEILNLHLEGRIPVFEAEYRRMDRSGNWRWAQVRGKVVAFGSDGAPIRMTGVIMDISDRKASELALQEKERKYRSLFEESIAPIFCTDVAGTIVEANPACEDLFGYTLDELLGSSIMALYVEPADRMAFRRDVERSGFVKDYYQRYRKKDGKQIECITQASVVKSEDGKVLGYRGNLRDITEQQEVQDQLRQSQKMEAVGTLTGGVAHDFNNLLTIINGYAEMLLLDRAEDDPSYGDLQTILQTGRKGAEMVRRLLAFSKKSEITPQPLDLNVMIENSVDLMKRTFPQMIEIETALEKELDMANADSAQVEQVLMNLCINAREAMREGGQLRIETRNTYVDEGSCRLHPGSKPGRHILIEISDTGTGMSKETMERMFDPFFTTKGWDFRKGTGLGLSVAKGIVEQHGGWITCETKPGTGTAFRIYFPAIEEPPVVRKSESLAEIVLCGEKILLVDDEEFVRDLGKRILDRAGYTVISAANGKEALDIYARNQSDIGLVITDLIMPQMGGEKCLEELLKVNPQVKVIVSTGHSLAAHERDRLGAHAKGFVNKPYEVRQLVQTVREVLDAEGAAG